MMRDSTVLVLVIVGAFLLAWAIEAAWHRWRPPASTREET